MTTLIEYALMAGSSYVSTRQEINQFPVPDCWIETKHDNPPDGSGFEAISFVRSGTTLGTSTEIVISFAGTDPGDLTGDIAADLALAAGRLSDQLVHAAAYYLQVKASAPANATISITGHSLGGGLASLVAAFFGESAFTFDQAPFLNSALIYTTAEHLLSLEP